MKRARFGLLLSCAVFGAAAPSALADSPTLYVGANPSSCPQAQYPTISSAVAAAPPGATIVVCPGTYAEHVAITKPLTLLGARANANAGTAPAATATPDPSRDSIIVNGGQGAVDVTASNVTISGFTIQGTPPAPSPGAYPDAGIYVHGGSNQVAITSDVLTGNGLGLYFDGAVDGLTITKDGFSGNTRADSTGEPSGGIFSAGGGPVTGNVISNDYFTRDDQFAINLGDQSSGTVVDHNEADQEGSILVLGNAVSPEVDFDHGTAIGGSALLLFGNTQNADVEHNVISGTGPSDPNGGSGVRTYSNVFGTPVPNSNATIAHNNLSNFTYDGLHLGGLINSLVTDNGSTNNGRDGFNVDNVFSPAANNTLSNNRASGNGALDCQDSTVGPGTSGTANYWIKDKGQTASPAGICGK